MVFEKLMLNRFIAREIIKVGISDVDKWTAIEELVDLIITSGRSDKREGILSAILDRERQGSTGLENGIAIPHARTDAVSEFVCAIGVSKEGIDFDSLDGKPCHLIFLIVGPTQESTKYLKALSAAAFIGKDETRVARLKSAGSPEEVIEILEEIRIGIS